MIYHTDFVFEPFPVKVNLGILMIFLGEYVNEITTILQEGIEIADIHYTVEVRCYICDIPARCFAKATVGHTGFFCCERCTIKGKTVNKNRVYPSTNCPLRTEESFYQQEQAEHHNGTTPVSYTHLTLPTNREV